MGRYRRKKQKAEPEIPTASFGDLAFLLIIYFILATSLNVEVGFQTDVPAGQKAKQATEEKSVLLKHDGLYWGEDRVTVEELQLTLTKMDLAKRDPNHQIVQFEAKGRMIPWQQYYEVLAAIRASGGIPGIVTESDEKK